MKTATRVPNSNPFNLMQGVMSNGNALKRNVVLSEQVTLSTDAPLLFNGYPFEAYAPSEIPGFDGPIVPNTGGRRKRQ